MRFLALLAALTVAALAVYGGSVLLAPAERPCPVDNVTVLADRGDTTVCVPPR